MSKVPSNIRRNTALEVKHDASEHRLELVDMKVRLTGLQEEAPTVVAVTIADLKRSKIREKRTSDS